MKLTDDEILAVVDKKLDALQLERPYCLLGCFLNSPGKSKTEVQNHIRKAILKYQEDITVLREADDFLKHA